MINSIISCFTNGNDCLQCSIHTTIVNQLTLKNLVAVAIHATKNNNVKSWPAIASLYS